MAVFTGSLSLSLHGGMIEYVCGGCAVALSAYHDDNPVFCPFCHGEMERSRHTRDAIKHVYVCRRCYAATTNVQDIIPTCRKCEYPYVD